MKTSYHTEIKYLARHELLSSDILYQIPRSNIYRWKHEEDHKYKCFDRNFQGQQEYEILTAFANDKG